MALILKCVFRHLAKKGPPVIPYSKKILQFPVARHLLLSVMTFKLDLHSYLRSQKCKVNFSFVLFFDPD
jgi:hypothetical protein